MTPGDLDHDALVERGFATVGLFDRRELRRLRRMWRKLGVDPTENYYASNVHATRQVARAVDQELKRFARAVLDTVVPGTTTFLAAFIAKGAGGGFVDLHPDWTYTDERTSRSLIFWCPLVDTDERNGTMYVLPDTHRRLQGIRGSGDFPDPVAGISDADLDTAQVTVPLEAGRAVVWDAALVHGSGPNPGADPRPAVAFARAPIGAELVHFHRQPEGPLEGYAIDESYYTTDEFGTAPSAGRLIEPWDGVVAPLSAEDLITTP